MFFANISQSYQSMDFNGSPNLLTINRLQLANGFCTTFPFFSYEKLTKSRFIYKLTRWSNGCYHITNLDSRASVFMFNLVLFRSIAPPALSAASSSVFFPFRPVIRSWPICLLLPRTFQVYNTARFKICDTNKYRRSDWRQSRQHFSWI